MECRELYLRSDSTFILSNYSLVASTVVQVGCRQFGHRLTAGEQPITCTAGNWNPNQTNYTCKWNGDLNTYEKLIIGTSAAGGGALLFGFLLICCIAANVKDKRKSENDVDSYPPSAINEKVGYAQYGNGFGDGGGGGGISGYRPSGKYEKQIIPDSRSDYRQEPMKRDPILWSNASASHQRDVVKTDETSGYHFYTGKNPSAQHDNRAFDRNDYDRGSGYRDNGYHGTNYIQGKREDYRW